MTRPDDELRDEWEVPLDESFIAAAPVHEGTAADRAARASRIARGHDRAQGWRAPVEPVGRGPRRRARERATFVAVLILCAAVFALLPRAGGGALPTSEAAGDGTPRVPRPADAQDTRVLPAVQAPVGEGGYELLVAQLGQPITFDPCRPVHWVVRDSGGPPQGTALLQQAFAVLSGATGLAFVHDGVTDEAYDPERRMVQRERYGDRYAPVLVVWAEPAEAPDLEGPVGGFAGPQAADPDGAGARFVTGEVVLDAPQLASMDRAGQLSVVLHELGHLVGLGHVDDPADSMYARSGPLTSYTAGALRGLAVVGSGRCFR